MTTRVFARRMAARLALVLAAVLFSSISVMPPTQALATDGPGVGSSGTAQVSSMPVVDKLAPAPSKLAGANRRRLTEDPLGLRRLKAAAADKAAATRKPKSPATLAPASAPLAAVYTGNSQTGIASNGTVLSGFGRINNGTTALGPRDGVLSLRVQF